MVGIATYTPREIWYILGEKRKNEQLPASARKSDAEIAKETMQMNANIKARFHEIRPNGVRYVYYKHNIDPK